MVKHFLLERNDLIKLGSRVRVFPGGGGGYCIKDLQNKDSPQAGLI